MKKLFGLTLITAALAFSTAAHAQDKNETSAGQDLKSGTKKVVHKTGDGAKKVAHATAKGAKKVGHKTAEVASKGKAKITDEVYKDKTGPTGEVVYIDNHSKYYYVDKKGTRHYVEETELKAKD